MGRGFRAGVIGKEKGGLAGNCLLRTTPPLCRLPDPEPGGDGGKEIDVMAKNMQESTRIIV